MAKEKAKANDAFLPPAMELLNRNKKRENQAKEESQRITLIANGALQFFDSVEEEGAFLRRQGRNCKEHTVTC